MDRGSREGRRDRASERADSHLPTLHTPTLRRPQQTATHICKPPVSILHGRLNLIANRPEPRDPQILTITGSPRLLPSQTPQHTNPEHKYPQVCTEAGADSPPGPRNRPDAPLRLDPLQDHPTADPPWSLKQPLLRPQPPTQSPGHPPPSPGGCSLPSGPTFLGPVWICTEPVFFHPIRADQATASQTSAISSCTMWGTETGFWEGRQHPLKEQRHTTGGQEPCDGRSGKTQGERWASGKDGSKVAP